MVRTSDPDDDGDAAALRWDDVDDASYLTAADELEGEAETGQDGVDGSQSDAAVLAGSSGASADRSRAASTAVTVAAALLYGAYTIAWAIGVGRIPLSGPTLALEIAYQFAEFLAIVASALWFAATMVMSRGKLRRRVSWLALGALFLLPWPFLIGVLS